MDNEFQESQYDKDFESYDDYQKYDENSNEQHVDNNVQNSNYTSVKRKCDQKETETLASNVTDLFRNGMNEEQYSDLIYQR